MDMYHLSRLLKVMLDENLAQAEVEGVHKAKLYTIGIRVKDQFEISFNCCIDLKVILADYAKLRIAICWAWNIRNQGNQSTKHRNT
nr:12774_t:CDS:2 [Entrophospora candida]